MDVASAGKSLSHDFADAILKSEDAAAVLLAMGGHLKEERRNLPWDGRLARATSRIKFEVDKAKATKSLAISTFRVHVILSEPLQLEVVVSKEFGDPALFDSAAKTRGWTVYGLFERFRDLFLVLIGAIFDNEAFFIKSCFEKLGSASNFKTPSFDFLVSWEDLETRPDIVTISRLRGNNNVLMPDYYFHRSDGYARMKGLAACNIHSWPTRARQVFWRGASTGSMFGLNDLLANERIKLAAICAERPDMFDVKIAGVVNVKGGTIREVEAALTARRLLGDRVNMAAFSKYQFALHVDGNASAAGFFEKMALGCCVLRTESKFDQWFEPRVQPWVHYVPVALDGRDLEEKATFLFHNPDLSEKIARCGFDFAVSADVSQEGRLLCESIVKAHAHASEIVHRLYAPLDQEIKHLSDSAPSAWGGIELRPGAAFRWTRSPEAPFPIPQDMKSASQIRLIVPYLGGINKDFPSQCHIVVDGQELETTVYAGAFEASYYVESNPPSSITLRTPSPLAPADINPNSTDKRHLGIAIPVR